MHVAQTKIKTFDECTEKFITFSEIPLRRHDPQVLSAEEQIRAASNDYNFDHPDAFDFDLLTDTLRKLKQGKSVKIPVYDFTTHGRQKDWVRTDTHTCHCSLWIMEYDLHSLIN